MGNIAKILLGLIIIISVLLPSAALRIRGLISDQEERISGLEDVLEETRKELEEIRQTLERTRKELDDTREELARTKRELDSARAEISRLQGELRKEKQAREKAEADLKTRTEELSSARAEIRRKETEISGLKSRVEELEKKIAGQEEEIETLKKAAGVAEVHVEDVPFAEGRVTAAAAGVLTVSFRGNLGIDPLSDLFIYRRERILERVSLRQFHETYVVFRFSEEKAGKARVGDIAVMEEGGNFLVPEDFAGAVSEFRRQGFATIEVSEESFVRDAPAISVYRGGELVFEAVPEAILSAVAVAELQVGEGTRIRRTDTVMIGR